MKLALLQFAPRFGVLEPNLRLVLDGVRDAADAGAELLVTPEMCLTGWTLRDPDLRAQLVAETEDVAVPELARASQEHGVGLVVGGPVRASDGGGSNSVIAFGPDGGRVTNRKLHLFGEEAAWWTPGDAVDTVNVSGASIGPLICYDGEFPEVPRLLRLAGAVVIAVATTNMTPYERDQDLIFATRALENECVVAVCNRVGSENDWTYFGRSLVADARGGIVAQTGSDEELLVVDVDLPDASPDPRLGYLSRRRPELYAGLARTDRSSSRPSDGASGPVAIRSAR